ncbi:MAG: hypothetical protein WCV62_05160 [Candidatus Peribacteraceae bacterium]|jgi:hypothetical protein
MLPTTRLTKLSLFLGILSVASAGVALRSTIRLGASLDEYYLFQSSQGVVAERSPGTEIMERTASGGVMEEQSSLLGTLQPLE